MKLPDAYRRFEPLVFFLFALLGALPVFMVSYFPTLDGPAHQYNARLMRYLIGGHEPMINSYFMFSREILPNWFGHALLFFFNLFLPSAYAVKAVLLCYILGLPLAFRYLVVGLDRGNALLSYLIFPYVYTLFFLLGFYNFNMALVLLFLASGYWIRSAIKPGVLRYAGMFVLVVCTYFSHLFVFVVLMMILGLYEAGGLIRDFRSRLRKSLLLALICIPSVLLCFFYLIGHELPNKVYLPSEELTHYILNFSPLITLDFQALVSYSQATMWLALCLSGIACCLRVTRFLQSPDRKSQSFLSFFKGGDGWLMLSVLLLLLYYVLPDSDGIAGYVSLRLCLLVFLALLAWIAQQQLPFWALIPALVITIGVFQKQVRYHIESTKELSSIAEQFQEAAHYLEPDKVVLPLDYSGNWMMGHMSNYLGHEKPVVLLENYEASLPFFPLRFIQSSPAPVSADSPVNQCNGYPWDRNKGLQTIDYVCTYGRVDNHTDSCVVQTGRWIANNYVQVYEGSWVHLYKRKK
jgi:hypothetical protein